MKSILKEKNIKHIVHFTSADNIKYILKYGLQPRSNLNCLGLNYCYNDMYRFDKCINALCTSIEFPNYKMFYRIRNEAAEHDDNTDWVVLLINAKVLCYYDCAFCTTNAGSKEMYDTPLQKRKGKKAFLKLFYELQDGHTRNELGIYDCYPTNPQAEVLIFNSIPIDYIESVNFQNDQILNKYKLFNNNNKFKVNPELFCPRTDYEYWRTH